MKTRKMLSVLLIMILLVSLSPAAFAAVEFASDEASFTGEHDATVFLAGSNPVTDAKIGGILFTAGNTVTTGGSCEYAFVAGNVLSFASSCAKDAFIGGNSVAVSGSVGRDLMSAANTLNLSGSVGRDLFAGAKTVTISGEIGGDVLLAADEIRIADSAKIGGTLHYNSDAVITGPTAILSEANAYSMGGEDANNYSSLFSYIQEYSAVQDSHIAAEGSAAPAESAAPTESSAPAESTTTTTSTSTTTTTTTANTPAPAPSSAESGSSRSSVGPRIKSRVFSYIGLVLVAFALLWLTPLWEKLDSVYTGADFRRLRHRLRCFGGPAHCGHHSDDHRLWHAPRPRAAVCLLCRPCRSARLPRLLCGRADLAEALQAPRQLLGRACHRHSGLASGKPDPLREARHELCDRASRPRRAGASARQEESRADCPGPCGHGRFQKAQASEGLKILYTYSDDRTACDRPIFSYASVRYHSRFLPVSGSKTWAELPAKRKRTVSPGS